MRSNKRGDLDINAGMALTRSRPMTGPGEAAVVAERRRAARRNLAGFALERDDPARFLTEMIDTLGLRPCHDPGEGR